MRLPLSSTLELKPATVPAVLISATASPPVRYIKVSAEATAQRREPIQFLRAVERRGRRRDVADRRIAERAGTNEGRGGVLRRELDVGLDAGHQPTARHPIVAALKAGDHAVEIVRGTGGEQRRARG